MKTQGQIFHILLIRTLLNYMISYKYINRENNRSFNYDEGRIKNDEI